MLTALIALAVVAGVLALIFAIVGVSAFIKGDLKYLKWW